MEIPPIRYARTADDVNIAYWVAGDGPPLIYVPELISHASAGWDVPPFRDWLVDLVSHFRVVFVNPRNAGLSGDGAGDITPKALAADIEAVVDATSLTRAALLAEHAAGPGAIQFASQHADLLRHLVLSSTYASYKKFLTRMPASAALSRTVSEDSRTYAELLFPAGLGSSQTPELVKAVAGWAYQMLEGHELSLLMGARLLHETEDAARAITTPTLILQGTNFWFGAPVGVDLAATIPGSRLVTLPGDGLWLWTGDRRPALHAILEFVGAQGVEHASSHSQPSFAPAFRTLLFTDLEGHTAMMSRLGDAKGREVLREHERITREALAAHGGQEVKTMGDGFMASFGSAQRALECAVALQRAVAGGIGGEALRIRAGINAGEPIAEDDDLFGSSVIAAARIAGKASGGQVLVSDVVRQLVAGKGFLFSDTGLHDLKGLEEPARLWELRWEA